MGILKSAGLVSLFTMVSRISGFVRDIMIANIIGVSTIADVFFAAFKLTNVLRKVLIEGSFFAAFVPSFTKIKEHYGIKEAESFASKMFSISFYIVIIITIFANIFMPQITHIMAPGFSGKKLSMTISLSYIVFWYFVAIALISIISGVLNGLHKFSYYSIVPIFMNISMIVFILFFRDLFKNIGYCLAWSVVVGGIIQFLFIYFACVYEKFKIRLNIPNKSLFDKHTKESYKKMIPSIIGGGTTQINTMIDLILGSYIISGVSYLYYVDRIFFLPTSIIGTAISIVILPFISKQIANKQMNEAQKSIKDAINLAAILVFPASFLLIFNSELLVSILFERGAFQKNDVIIVAKMLILLGIALPFCVMSKIMSSIFFGNSNTKTPMYITFITVFINVIFSVSLMPYFGIYAITTGTMISYIASFFINLIILLRKKMLFVEKSTIIFIAKTTIISAITFIVMKYISMNSIFAYNLFYDLSIFYKLTYIFMLLLFSGIVYTIFGLFFGMNFFKMLLKLR